MSRPLRHKPASASISSLSALFDNSSLNQAPPSPGGYSNNNSNIPSSPKKERPGSGNWGGILSSGTSGSSNNNGNTDYEEVQNRTFVKW